MRLMENTISGIARVIVVTEIKPSPTAEDIDDVFEFIETAGEHGDADACISKLCKKHGEEWALAVVDNVLSILEYVMRN